MKCDVRKSEPQELLALGSLRVLGMIMIFFNHVWAYLPFSIPDFGARGVELFFLLSGFLLAFNYYEKDIDASLKARFRFAMHRIRKFYVLHIITLVIMLIFLFRDIFQAEIDLTSILEILGNFIVNALLLQSWIPLKSVYWGFNGVSWFLSSLVFCYFMFPIIIKFIKKLENVNSILLVACVLSLTLLFFQTIYSANAGWNPEFILYIFPPYRAVSFAIGCLFGVVFIKTRKSSSHEQGFGTVLEIITLAIYLLSMFVCNLLWNSKIHELVAMLVIYILSCQLGGLSAALSKKWIRSIGKISFDFYLIHHVVIVLFSNYGWILLGGKEVAWGWQVLIMFFLSVIISTLFHNVYECVRQSKKKSVSHKA